MLHILRFFFSSRCRLFHNAIFFGSCNIHILNTGVLKFWRKFRGQRVNLILCPIWALAKNWSVLGLRSWWETPCKGDTCPSCESHQGCTNFRVLCASMSLGHNPAKELHTARSCIVINSAKWYIYVETSSSVEGHRLLGCEAVQFGIKIIKLQDFKLPPQCKWDLLSFGILRYIKSQKIADLRY